MGTLRGTKISFSQPALSFSPGGICDRSLQGTTSIGLSNQCDSSDWTDVLIYMKVCLSWKKTSAVLQSPRYCVGTLVKQPGSWTYLILGRQAGIQDIASFTLENLVNICDFFSHEQSNFQEWPHLKIKQKEDDIGIKREPSLKGFPAHDTSLF